MSKCKIASCNIFSKLAGICLMLSVISCQPKADDSVHSHADGDAHAHAPDDVPAQSFTIWTEHTELFVEFPALVAKKTSKFAAHFTALDGHQPITSGTVTVSLLRGSQGVKQTVDEPTSPGIFGPSLQPQEAGVYQLVFDLITPTYTDQIEIKDLQVFATLAEAQHAIPHPADPEIAFLKEQAWKIDFQTAPVIDATIYNIIPTAGTWQMSPSNLKTLVATSDGTVNFIRSQMTEGMRVSAGQTLINVSSSGLTNNNLGAEIRKAEGAFSQVEADFVRKKLLYDSSVIAKAEFEIVESQYEVAKTNLETLKAGYSAKGKPIKAPFNGFVRSMAVESGDFVSQGAELLTIARGQSNLLEVQISPALSSRFKDIKDILFKASSNDWVSLNQSEGKILSTSKTVDVVDQSLSIFAQFGNQTSMPEGSFSEVQVALGDAENTLTIPTSALLEDFGAYSVIVQAGGESFERRNITIGKRNGDQVEVLSGLELDEMVVSVGAYQVKMAAMAGQAPAHGHEH